MNKKEFLNKLETELKKNNIKDYQDIIQYYSELIDDKLEQKKATEKEIIKEIDIDNIIKNLKIEKQLNAASEKPTLSNGIKSLIAVLSVLSLPLLIPAVVLVCALGITIGSLLFALVAVIFSLIIAAIAIMGALIIGVFVNNLPLSTGMVILGISIVSLILLIELIKWVYSIMKNSIVWSIDFLRKTINNKGKVSSND